MTLSADHDGVASLITEMMETSRAISAETEPRARLRVILRRAQQLAGAQYAALSVFDNEGAVCQVLFEGMDERQAQALATTPSGRGLLGLLAQYTEPLRLDDLREHPSFTGLPDGHPEMAAFVGVPLLRAGRLLLHSISQGIRAKRRSARSTSAP
jgi:signal transduction protein with GAF and PtsI domain